MAVTFTFKSPDELTSREVYHQLYHSLRRAVGTSPELTFLWGSPDILSRSFALHNGEEAELRDAVDDIDLRGCLVVTPAEEAPAPPVVVIPSAEPAPEQVEEEAVQADAVVEEAVSAEEAAPPTDTPS